jgi:HlyD family type I secretion membrane fusion protein
MPRRGEGSASPNEEISPSSEGPAPRRSSASSSGERPPNRDNAALFELGEHSDAREFLLAERPTFVRGTLYLSLLLLAALVAWSFIGRIDIVVSAPGIVRPRGDVVQVQAPVGGVVTEILPGIREGSTIAANEVLLRFDPKPLQIERQNVASKIEGKRREKFEAEEARKRLAQAYEAEKATRETDVRQAELEVETEQTRRDYGVAQAKARLEIAEARLRATKARVDEQEKKVAEAERLVNAGVKRAIELEDEKRALGSVRADVEPAEKAVEEARLACAPDETQIKLAVGRLALRKKALDELAATEAIKDGDARARISLIEAEVVSLENERDAVDLRVQRAELRAPVGGMITKLAVTHAGRVVPEGSTVAEISPSGRDLVLEAYVRNNDRGQLQVGRRAKLRFAAYPYQEYGALDGEVNAVSPDAEKAPSDAPQGVSQDPLYRVTVTFAKDELSSSRGKRGRIELGMAAQADIVVEEKPIAFVILSELKDFFDTRSRP